MDIFMKAFTDIQQQRPDLDMASTEHVEDFFDLPQFVSRRLINWLASRTPARPHAFSLWSAVPKPPPIDRQGPVNDYTSWPGLKDRTFTSRHLPPAPQSYVDALPRHGACSPTATEADPVTALFQRTQLKTGRSSVLFGYFAQWFTDSFLRTDPLDRRRNTSNHEIDLCQIYGLTEETTRTLRSMKGGQLSSQLIDDEEYPDALYEKDADGDAKVRDQYATLPYVKNGLLDLILQQQGVPDSRKIRLYATGLERGNSSIGYVSMSTLFLREHNRLARELHSRNPGWDDERLFQTARMINTVQLLRIVVEDYINHIAGRRFFVFDQSFAEEQTWYRSNWISVEFNLLYRWHGLVPDTVNIGAQQYKPLDFQSNNKLLEDIGLATLINDASSQPAGQISLFNTPHFLLWAECQSVKMGRDFRLASYNDYRERFSLDRLQNWHELTTDQQVLQALQQLYPQGIDQLELVIGLFAEQSKGQALFGDLMNTMVSVDAFTQALTNPLLASEVYNVQTFTQFGLDCIEATPSLQALVERNVTGGNGVRVSFDHQ